MCLFIKVGEDDPHIYPEVLDKLLKIEFALRVKYQPHYRQASVNTFSRDEVLIKNIKDRLHSNEVQPEAQRVSEVYYVYLLRNCIYYC